MGVRVGIRACLVVVRCEDKSAGVSLTPSSLGFPWSVLDPPIGEEFADPTLTTLHVLCHTCNICGLLLSMATEFNGLCVCVSLPVVDSISQMAWGGHYRE